MCHIAYYNATWKIDDTVTATGDAPEDYTTSIIGSIFFFFVPCHYIFFKFAFFDIFRPKCCVVTISATQSTIPSCCSTSCPTCSMKYIQQAFTLINNISISPTRQLNGTKTILCRMVLHDIQVLTIVQLVRFYPSFEFLSNSFNNVSQTTFPS
jgi:hypothetical protein